MEHQFVIFELDGEAYGVSIAAVETIIKMQKVTRLPNMPSFLQGVTNLRGKVLPVVDLRRRFALPQRAADPKTRIIVVSLDTHQLGLVVDGVTEVVTVPADAVEPPPDLALSVNSDFITGIARMDERLIILLDLMKVLGEEEQASLPGVAEAAARQAKDASAPAGSASSVLNPAAVAG